MLFRVGLEVFLWEYRLAGRLSVLRRGRVVAWDDGTVAVAVSGWWKDRVVFRPLNEVYATAREAEGCWAW